MPDFPQVGLEAVLVTAAFEKGGKVVSDVLDKTNQELEGTEESSAGAGGALDTLGGIASGVATGGLTLLIGAVAAVGAALVGVSTAGLKFASEFSGVMRTVEAQTGATGAELEAFRNTAEQVYQTGLGENFADVAQAMVQVEQMTGAAGEELQALTTSALTMSEVFDVDVAESVRAVDQAMVAFGASGTDVFDMMTTTIQQTGDPMDDLADTINEYAQNFADAGFSAEEMFGILNAGLEAGAWNFDKVGDTVREFFIRLEDGSDTTKDALNELFSTPGDAVSVLDDQIGDLNLEIENQEVALAGVRTALDAANAAWNASKQSVSDLSSALSQAQSELSAMSQPNLAGLQEMDDTIFSLSQQAKQARLSMIDMQRGVDAALAGIKGDIDKLTGSIEKQEDSLYDTKKALDSAKGAWAASQKVVDDLKSALDEARRELDDLSRPNLEGMEEYDDQMFELGQQSKALQLAMLDMEEDTPEFAAAQAELDALSTEMERLKLAYDLEFDAQFRALEEAASDSTEEVLTFEEALAAIAEKKEEIIELEGSMVDAEAAAEADRKEVERLEAVYEDLAGALAKDKERLADLNKEFAETKSEKLAAARAELERINQELQKAQLQKELTFDAQFRAIEEAVGDGVGEVVTMEEALAQIAAKKEEIAGLEAALAGAEAAAAADAQAVSGLESEYEALEGALGGNKDQLELLVKELENSDTPAQKFLDTLTEGGMTGPEAMSKIIQALEEIEDPIERNKIGAALFGSMWEDLGGNVVMAMDPAKAAMGDFEGATGDAQEAVGAGLGGAWERLQRVLQVVLADGFAPVLAALVDNLVPAFEAFAEWLKGDGSKVLEALGAFLADTLGPALANLGPFIEEKVLPALVRFGDWFIEEGLPAIQDLIDWIIKKGIPRFKKFIDFIIKKVIPALDKLVHPFREVRKAIDETIKKFESIIETLGDVVEAVIDWAIDFVKEIGTALKDAVQAVIDWGVDFLRELGTILADWISDMIDWGIDMVRELVDILVDAVDAVIDWGVDFLGELGTILADWISDMISWGIDMVSELASILGDAVDAVIDWGVDFLGELGTILADWISDMISWGIDMVGELGDILGDAVDAVIDWGVDFLGELGTILADWISDMTTWGIDMVGELVSILGDAVQAVIDFADEMLDAAGQMMQGLIDGITGAAEGVTTALGDVVAGAIESLQSAIEIGGALGSQLATIGGLIIGRISDAVTEHGPEVQTALEDAVAFAAEQLDILLNGEGTLVDRLKTIGTNIIERLKDGLFALFGTPGEEEHPIFTALKGVIEGAISALVTALGKAADAGKAVIEAGKEIIYRIVDGISEVGSDIFWAIARMIDNAFEDAFGVRPFGTDREGGRGRRGSGGGLTQSTNWVGQSIAAGIAQGIYDGSHWVAEAAVWSVQNALAAAQAAAGVHSPSTLFAGLGRDLMAGFSMGIAAPSLVSAPTLGSGSNTSIVQNFHVGGNTINSGVDEAIFEARVSAVIRRELSGAGGGLF